MLTHLRFSFLCGVLLWLLRLPTAAQVPGLPPPRTGSGTSIEPGRLVFRLKPAYAAQAKPNGVAVPALQNALSSLGAATVHQKFPHAQRLELARPQAGAVDLSLLYQVEFDRNLAPEKACRLLMLSGAVEYAEPRYIREPLYQPTDPMSDSTIAKVEYFQTQYYLRNIQAYGAWDVTKGDTSIVIAIVDGGTRYTHEDLATQLQVNRLDPIDGIDNDKDGYIDNYRGWDFADNDNDATRETNSVHGILVAGCAAARADNAKGIAGVGFRSRFLPLKIYPSTPQGSFAGFEAIVYAADHGCKVINLSWGGAGGRSQYEQDIINYAAVNHDAVVVAAAGNTNAELDFYPASYDHVLSVASMHPADLKDPNGTFSRHVSVSAPGMGILTILGNNDSDYYPVTGSSFAAPLVSGTAALVRARFPHFTADQVAAQIRQTTDNVYTIPGNEVYLGKLGTGRLNAKRAVTLTDRRAARITSSRFTPIRKAYAPGDTIQLIADLQNLLQPVGGLTVTLSSLSPYLIIRQGSFAPGPLSTLQKTSNQAKPFRLEVATKVPLNTQVVLRYHLQDAASGYQEDQYETLTLNPEYVVMNVNDLRLTLSEGGKLAYANLGMDTGEGVSYKGSTPMLYEGGLMIGTSATRVADNVRHDGVGNNMDFYSLVRTSLRERPLRADQEAYSVYRDSLPSSKRPQGLGIRVRQVTYAFAAAPHRDYVVLEYHLTNLSADTIRPLHTGLFMDWDLAPSVGRNVANWDSVRSLGYVYDPAVPTLYAGVKLLTGGLPSVYSIDNAAPSSAPVYLGNGFSTAEKFLTLSSGTRKSRSAGLPSGADVSQVTGATLKRLAPRDSVVVAFAVLAAPSLAQLQTTAEVAQARYASVLPVTPTALLTGVQLYPNPTAGRLRLTLPTGLGPATVRVLSALGQTILTQTIPGTGAELNLSGRAAGVYIVQVSTEAGLSTHHIMLQP